MLLALDGVEEFGVGLGLLPAVDKEFNRADFIHVLQDLAQIPVISGRGPPHRLPALRAARNGAQALPANCRSDFSRDKPHRRS